MRLATLAAGLKREVTINRPMFEPRLRILYGMILGSAVAALILIVATGFTVTPAALAIFVTPAYVAVAGILSRRIGKPRLAAALEGGGLAYGKGLALLLLLFPLTALSGPYADPTLSALDRRLGFDWFAYLELSRPFTSPLVLAYNSFAWQPAVVVLALALTSRYVKLWRFIMASFLACVVVALAFPFVPAEAPFSHYGVTPAMFPELKAPETRDFLLVVHGIRDGQRIIDPQFFTGVASFPSLHAAMALIFAWAAWPVSWLRWPVAALNLAMLAATPVIGNHYLVDVIAGLALAAVAIIAAKRIMPESAPE